MKYIISALALAGAAAAAECSAATTTIQNSGDASGLATCQTFTGTIAVATNTADNIALDGIEEITGSLISKDAGRLPGISSSTLKKISDTFQLSNITVLSSLNFPSLTEVGKIDWVSVPNLRQLSFTSAVKMAKTLRIENTGLASLNGINLQTAETVYLANNKELQSISMQLGNVSTGITLLANGRNLTAEFPNLIWAKDISLNNVSTLRIPSLTALNGSLGFYSNYFDSINAPNLTTVANSLSIAGCQQLTNVSFPLLKSVGGGLQVANNSKLDNITSFPSLTTIGGALDFNGTFSDATLPKITTIRGAFNMQSTGNLTAVCNYYKPLAGQNNVIQGNYVCKGSQSNPQTLGGTGSSTSSGSGSSGTPTGAASAVQISGVTGLLGVVAAIFGLL